MLSYVVGDLLQSEAEALVNTVNCEGYMGKGIAYQFKFRYPKNNEDYVKACKKGWLRPGKLHHFQEREKIIINFPTKDKWRQKSKMEYIESGLDSLVDAIKELKLKSIAIPPLGSGNGGLNWSSVKEVIEKKLAQVDPEVEIYIYEPSSDYSNKALSKPKLSVSALVLMDIKQRLNKATRSRLQKAAYFVNRFSGKNFFTFQVSKLGLYDASIESISKRIGDLKQLYSCESTKEVRDALYAELVSDSVNSTLRELAPSIDKACAFVNGIESDHDLECITMICAVLERDKRADGQKIAQQIEDWSVKSGGHFGNEEVEKGIECLCNEGLIRKTLIDYELV